MDDVLALFILQFDKFFEVDSSGRVWKPAAVVVNRRAGRKLNESDPEKRVGPLAYLRYPLASAAQNADAGDLLCLRMQQISQHVGRANTGKVRDLFFGLAGIAANKISTKRGWVVNAAAEAGGGQEIADILYSDLEDVAWGLEVLRHYKLIEWRACPLANRLIPPVSFGVTEQQKRAPLNLANPYKPIPNPNTNQIKDQGLAEKKAGGPAEPDLVGFARGGGRRSRRVG